MARIFVSLRDTVEKPVEIASVVHRSLEKQPKIWRNVRSLAVAARLGAVRLDREFFISIGGPQVHEHSFAEPPHVGIGYRSLTLAARLAAVRNWRSFITIGGPQVHGHSFAVAARPGAVHPLVKQ